MARKASKAENLEQEYEVLRPLADRLNVAISEQLSSIVRNENLTLGVPIESRVKSWQSISEKIERNNLTVKSIRELNDLVGVRTIFLFRDDLDNFQKLVRESFQIVSEEDASDRLEDSQFGYQSRHVIAQIPEKWLDIPSLSGLGNLKVEIQIRTLAQHIWAAASHKLQYKREESVPLSIRRAIYRVSALLETVDLEFLRVLDERKNYTEIESREAGVEESLNVDNLRIILDARFPKENKSEDEPYDKLLINLSDFGIDNVKKLNDLIDNHLLSILDTDKQEVEKRKYSKDFTGTSLSRNQRGVFYTHVGLGRQLLWKEFPSGKVSDSIMKTRN